jgi:hypothetical protein
MAMDVGRQEEDEETGAECRFKSRPRPPWSLSLREAAVAGKATLCKATLY